MMAGSHVIAAEATFLRGFNLNGPAVTVDGRPWESGATAQDFKAIGKTFENQKVVLRPPTDAARTAMIRSSVWGGKVELELANLPPGAYQVFLYVWEDNNDEQFDLLVNGKAVLAGFHSGTAGMWKRLGPWPAASVAGKLTVSAQAASHGAANLSGLEVWSGDGAIPEVAGAQFASSPTADQIAFFESKIRPVLVESCYECHSAGAKKIKGGLVLDSRAGVRKGGDTGPAITPGDPDASLLIQAVRHLSEDMDDICVIRSMEGDDNEHYNATLGMHTGSFFFSRPSIGSWVSYGLGTMNRNLPSFVALAPQMPYAGTQIFNNDFLPAYHQGVRVIGGKELIANLDRRTRQRGLQELELGLADVLNNRHLHARVGDTDLAARIRTFETAFHMQTEALEAFDLKQESDATLALYGMKRGQSEGFGWQCIVARRLAERGVRFIELVDGSSSDNWDQHGDMAEHAKHAKNIDQPIAGLLCDLKSRGLLEDTLVVWTTEFGRTPGVDGTKGRGHHSACFSSWLAGGGVKGGLAYGATDEIASTVVENKVHVHDFHATILHLLGINHENLTYRHGGRDYRLTDVFGKVVQDVLA